MASGGAGAGRGEGRSVLPSWVQQLVCLSSASEDTDEERARGWDSTDGGRRDREERGAGTI